MSVPALEPIELGFAEQVDNPVFLTSPYFPSKIGGHPAWLNPQHLPSTESAAADGLACPLCTKPMAFLLQLYTPVDDSPACFHRSVYVFCCRNGGCHKTASATGAHCFKVLRCQLPRENPYFGVDANDNVELDSSVQGQRRVALSAPTCAVCGNLGPKKCGQCGRARYCSREHQVAHWGAGHKQACSNASGNVAPTAKEVALRFPEFELVTEPEEVRPGDDGDEDDEAAEKRRMQEFEAAVKDFKLDVQTEEEGKDVDDLFDGSDTVQEEDECFEAFQKRVARDSEQVLRYQKGGKPLWISDVAQCAPGAVPRCLNCGTQRVFEFQIMPQLLWILGVDNLDGNSLDWGTLLVYTCPNDCNPQEASATTPAQPATEPASFASVAATNAKPVPVTSSAYLPEFLYSQQVSEKGSIDLQQRERRAPQPDARPEATNASP
ncbi:hypothetical protein CAOG_00340 [Capsaspora owczarzaki ATCC 30864]|uniref:MYND-type domain-containing protein n=1 Tax=Capsaspora owczarzaki (strain ATCC 30864) TaxID=595528 RepID=A0A0D2VG21_CAPO3|nr:hypothetical protein CAOG_00340 [Capsaspora owczarzaki ATCC 30864]KJE88747.1 hypothetical protein CAOG_000340 [Capsaspora owczarzaki ATCC 30864]|eukprot:XP_004365211.1 hypothetical protein CAOG_00340 [Capsaspora owczarzaki ATCC 30864]